MTLDELKHQLQQSPQSVTFQEVVDIVANYFEYTPTTFRNGRDDDTVINEAGQNEGSCKVFALAQSLGLTEVQTLHCFGDYYRVDVLQHPDASDHANIRSFMRYGWDGIHFEGRALKPRA